MDLTEERVKEYNKYYDLACEGIMELIVLGKGKYTPLEPSQESRVRKAIEYFNKALIIYTGHWPCMFFLGKLHQRLNEHETAIEYFESALVLDSENHNIPLEASISAMHLNKIDTVLYYSSEAMKRKPDHCEILGNHAYFLLVAGRYEEAREVIQKAVALYPDDETNELIEVITDKVIKGEIPKPEFGNAIGQQPKSFLL
jgi:tetratricopeptide (TPR) repeat protein